MEPTRLNASVTQVWGEGCPQLSPVPQDRIWGVAGGEIIDLGERELEIIESLGHSPHHIAIFDRMTRALFSGDAAGVFALGNERGNQDIVPPLFDVEKNIATLHRLRAFNPSVLLIFGFSGVSHSPDKTLQWAEEDIRAFERIVREGMKQKKSREEIDREAREYFDQVGISNPEGEGERGMGARIHGLFPYILKQDPSLEMPK